MESYEIIFIIVSDNCANNTYWFVVIVDLFTGGKPYEEFQEPDVGSKIQGGEKLACPELCHDQMLVICEISFKKIYLRAAMSQNQKLGERFSVAASGIGSAPWSEGPIFWGSESPRVGWYGVEPGWLGSSGVEWVRVWLGWVDETGRIRSSEVKWVRGIIVEVGWVEYGGLGTVE